MMKKQRSISSIGLSITRQVIVYMENKYKTPKELGLSMKCMIIWPCAIEIPELYELKWHDFKIKRLIEWKKMKTVLKWQVNKIR